MSYAELRARMAKGWATIDDLYQKVDGEKHPHTKTRLKGKADGVRLALSYLDEEIRLENDRQQDTDAELTELLTRVSDLVEAGNALLEENQRLRKLVHG